MSGRRILVTGAASGIGAALVQLLKSDGHDVVGLDLTAGDNIIPCDLSDHAAIVQFCENFSGPLDAVAHVAGLPGTQASDRILRVNFCAVRQLTDALADKVPNLSSIAVISSLTAHRCEMEEEKLAALACGTDDAILDNAVNMDGTAAYAFSKRLLNVWVEHMAARTQSSGLRVNAVAPGPVETPILDDFKTSMGSDKINKAAELVGRHGRPEEIAAAAAFLMSPQSSWINGVVLDCDGGFNAARRSAARASEAVNNQRLTL